MRIGVTLVGLLCLCGCGGGTVGVPIEGAVSLDGQPLPWGQVYLRSTMLDKASTTQQVILEVRDGQFRSESTGLAEGDYSVTVLIHEGMAPPPPDPSAAEASPPAPVVTGQWEGTAQVKADQKMALDLKKGELKLPEGAPPKPAPRGV
jgi:hypothetical protein